MSFPIAVLLSGSGRTLQNFIDRIAAGTLSVRITQVVASRPGVVGIDRAQKAGLPVEVVERKAFPSVEAFSERTFDLLPTRGLSYLGVGPGQQKTRGLCLGL